MSNLTQSYVEELRKENSRLHVRNIELESLLSSCLEVLDDLDIVQGFADKIEELQIMLNG